MTDQTTAVAPETQATETKKVAPKSRKKGKQTKQAPHARVYIQATYNNTLITITDLNGNVLAWSSAGHCGFKGPKKATPYAASMVVKNLLDKVSQVGLKDVSILVKGVGQGREGAIRAFNTNNINVLTIKDVTPIPHNGCRRPRARKL